MEARVGMSAHGGVVDGGTSTRKLIHHQHSPPKRQQQPVTQIGTVRQLLAGGIAGAFSKTCTAPLARLTILFQVLWFFFIFPDLLKVLIIGIIDCWKIEEEKKRRLKREQKK